MAPGWPTYSGQDGYVIAYAPDMTVMERQELTDAEATMMGTAFAFPASVGSGTVLLDARVDVGTGLPALCELTGSAAVLDSQPAVRFDWSGVGAGNLYQGTTYAALNDGRCYRLSLYVHTCNLGSDCYAGRTSPFDPEVLRPTFEAMVRSFRFTR